jgi:hypothetical protein
MENGRLLKEVAPLSSNQHAPVTKSLRANLPFNEALLGLIGCLECSVKLFILDAELLQGLLTDQVLQDLDS